MSFLHIDVFAWVMILILAVILPLHGRHDLKKLRAAIAGGDKDARQRLYRSIIVMEWSMAILGLVAWFLLGRNASTIWLRNDANQTELIAVAVSTILIALVGLYCYRSADNPKALTEARKATGSFAVFLPHSDADLRRFYWVSLAAGVCEEILYRGLLMGALQMTLGLWPAVILSSIVFGISHSYQGPVGILRTGTLGAILALVVVFTGSLWIAMIAHIVLDMSQGKMLKAAMSLTPHAEAPTPV